MLVAVQSFLLRNSRNLQSESGRALARSRFLPLRSTTLRLYGRRVVTSNTQSRQAVDRLGYGRVDDQNTQSRQVDRRQARGRVGIQSTRSCFRPFYQAARP